MEIAIKLQPTPAYAAIGADISQHRLYIATQHWFSGLTVGRIVNRKTKSRNFILSTIGRADIAPNIPTALSGAVVRNLIVKSMAKLAYKLVFPLALISFVLITKWWFAVPLDAPGTYFIGFPFPYACDGWHTSSSVQFFLMELVADFLAYYLAWFIFVFLINKLIKPIKINKAVFLTLISLNILILTPTIYFITNSNNIFYFKRPFEMTIFETGFKFIWQNEKEIKYEFYQFKQGN